MKRAATVEPAEERFAQIVAALAGSDDVEPPIEGGRRFGANALKVRGKIFAMLVRGEFVVKLPRERVAALVASGEGRHFATGGRVMREWIVVADVAGGRWRTLAEEACAAVRGRITR